jgi:TorA maturation chaperone TorD
MENSLQPKEQEQIAAVRRNLYLFFSSLLLNPPEPDFIRHLRALGYLKEIWQLFDPAASVNLEKFFQEDNSSLERLYRDFDNLFRIPLGNYVVPYESVYRDSWEQGGQKKKGLLMGPSAQAVKKIYRRAGTELTEHCAELPDHAGVELAFMHYLCQREQEAWQQDQIAQAMEWQRLEAEFVTCHLARWFPELCRKIEQKSQTAFYKGIARLIYEFILWEENTFKNGET